MSSVQLYKWTEISYLIETMLRQSESVNTTSIDKESTDTD